MNKKSFLRFKKIKMNSVFLKNFLVITFLEICVFGVMTAVYANKIKEDTISELMESNYSELKKNGEVLDTVIEQLKRYAYSIADEDEIKLLNAASDINEREEVISVLQEKMQDYKRILGYVDSIFVYMENWDWIICDNGKRQKTEMRDLGWLPMYEKTSGKKEGSPYLLGSRCKNENYPFYLTILYTMYNAKKEKTGAVVINIDLDSLNSALGCKDDEQQLYMINETGELLYSNVGRVIKYPELLPQDWEKICESCMNGKEIKALDEEKQTYFGTMKSETGGYYILYSQTGRYLERKKITERYIVRNTVWMIVVCALSSCLLAAHTYRPIRFILKEVDEHENDDKFIVGGKKNDEVQYILDKIQKAKRTNEKMALETKEWMQKLENAQMQVLQSQINPHFLYNTLDVINWMVMEKAGKENEASKAIYSLAQLLRMSVKRTSYLIPLKEEIEQIRLYLELLNLRYAGKIKTHWEIREELWDARVVRLCLQPIVENAVRHGLKNKRYCGDIYIRADRVNNVLIIRIEDNGTGMDREECIQMNRSLKMKYQVVDTHVGIKNVNQRMKILFGDDYGIQVRPRDGGGLVVVMCFPCD